MIDILMSTARIFRIFGEEGRDNMSMRNIRWKYVLLWALMALSVLSLGSYCYRAYALQRPLEKRLAQNPDVIRAQISSVHDRATITIGLKYVDNLSLSYSLIEKEVQAALGTLDYEIVLEDNSGEILEGAYASIHYYIEEARVRGNFGEMADRSRAALEDTGIEDFKLTVDGENIYVQMRLNDEYLYRVRNLKYTKGGAEL